MDYHEHMKKKYKSIMTALVFLFPNLVGFLVFLLFPIVLSLIMAFTNWSLKPALEFHFVGIRNFVDILGFRATSSGHTTLAVAYLVLCALSGLGLLGYLWAMMENWPGTRSAGALLAGFGLFLLMVFGLRHFREGMVVLGGVFVVIGSLGFSREGRLMCLGIGVAPVLGILIGITGLVLLHRSLWRHFEPNDLRFWQYLYNTLYLMLGMPVAILGSLGLALLINDPLALPARKHRFIGTVFCLFGAAATFLILFAMGLPSFAVIGSLFWMLCAAGLLFNVVAYRTVYYLPTFTAGVALMVLWKALYNPESGPVNVFLEWLFSLADSDLRGPRWLASIAWAKPALIIMGIWIALGGMNMLLYLAGLSTVSRDLLDAAEVDGANRWMKFRHVTWPHLAPTTFFITIISIIGGLQGGFEQARVMTLGGPAGSTTTLSYYIYNIAFGELDLGRAAAISWVLFAFVFAATAINWKFGKGLEVEY